MALKLIKSSATTAICGFVPYWYAAYRDGATVKTISLGVKLRGHPPATGYLGDRGDDAFERSRETAQAKLDAILEKGREKGEAIREQTTVIKIKTGRKFKDPPLKELGDIYMNRIGERSPGHVGTIKSGFDQFATFAARPDDPKVKRARTLAEVTPDLAVAFFRHVAASHAFSTVKKYSHRLTRVYALIYPGNDNPFAGARLNAVGSVNREDENGEKASVETVVHHRPIDRAQLRQLYATAKGDPLLYALTVAAASTGLRISDVCLLKWDDINLADAHPVIFLKTAKTHSLVAIPIFDYRPASSDYEADLGEFRRVLETALAEAKDGEKYVFPEAARLYLKLKKTDNDGKPLPRSKWTHPGRNVIYQRGKLLFARALFSDETEVVTTETDGENDEKSAEEILSTIAAADWTEERKRRVSAIYARYAGGESYLTILKATGYAKSTISADLAAVEAIAGVRVRARPTGKPSVRDLLQRTRKERAAGKRSASVYSWHSLRGSFVVMMRDNGVPLDTIRELVGHETVNMTLQYYNPTQKQAAESARKILANRNRRKAIADAAGAHTGRATARLPPPDTDAPQGKLDALRAALAALTPEERAELLKQTAKR